MPIKKCEIRSSAEDRFSAEVCGFALCSVAPPFGFDSSHGRNKRPQSIDPSQGDVNAPHSQNLGDGKKERKISILTGPKGKKLANTHTLASRPHRVYSEGTDPKGVEEIFDTPATR